MESSLIVKQILVFFCIGLGVSFFAGLWVGEERKRKWFQKRTKPSAFLRRGLLGEACHFGYPRTKEGYAVTIGIFVIAAFLYFLIIH